MNLHHPANGHPANVRPVKRLAPTPFPSDDITTTDEELMRGIAQKDVGAMHALFGRHQVRVFRFVARLCNDEALAEDITSEVFLDVWRKPGTYQQRSAVATWLLAIARHKAQSARRRNTEVTIDEQVVKNLGDPSADPEAALQQKHQTQLVEQCLTKLTPEHGEVISLVYYRGKTVTEVAQIVGIPVATVKTRMFYARRRIGELLATRRGFKPAAAFTSAGR